MSGPADARNERAFLAVEALLDHLHPREGADAQTRALRERFGSADALLRADPSLLEELGLRPGDALLLSRLAELSRCVQSAQFARCPWLGRLDEASRYLVALFHGLQVERFYLLCLDARGRLRERVLIQEGTSDSTLFNLRRVLSEALRTGADAAIISHNHPGLTLRPSDEDLCYTRDALRALGAVGIPLLDHIIVAGRQAVSIRQNAFLPASLWLDAAPGHRLLRGWLDETASGA